MDILLGLGLSVGLGLLAGATVSALISLVMKVVRRGNPDLGHLSNRLRLPQRVFCLVGGASLGIWIGSSEAVLGDVPAWRSGVLHAALICLILAAAFLGTGALRAFEDMILARHEDHPNEGHARRVRTQLQIITRVGIAAVWLAGVAGTLLTFDSFRAIGASVFASAGVLSIVAGLAAQSSLANLFAGLQIAFSDAIRVDDVVVVDDYLATVEEITLTYVVLRVWDGRRVVVPSTRFTTDSFENWTRRDPALIGTVLFDLDWQVPVAQVREQVMLITERSQWWDGEAVGLMVTDAVDGKVTVRATVSAKDSSDLWKLRCELREEVLNWLQQEVPEALPRLRFDPEPPTGESAKAK